MNFYVKIWNVQLSTYKRIAFDNTVCSSSPVSQSIPVYPEIQAQMYSLTPSVQLPPFSQELDMQSSTSKTKMTQRIPVKDSYILMSITFFLFKIWNIQLWTLGCRFNNKVCSSPPVSQSIPVYPGIQVQRYSLTPYVQFPPFSQGLGMQSLPSETKWYKDLLLSSYFSIIHKVSNVGNIFLKRRIK